MAKSKTQPEGRGVDGKLQIAAYVPRSLHVQLAELAEREGRSMAQVVRRAVEAEVERQAA